MLYEWVENVTVGEATFGWFSAAEDGHLAKSQWIWTDNSSRTADGNDDNHWWYADKHGELIMGRTKKINGKWYAFDDMGKMAWGFVWLTTPSGKSSDENTFVKEADPSEVSSSEILDAYSESGPYLHFFSADEEKDGSMKTGQSIKVELYDDDFTMGFDKNNGCALNGVYKNKLYNNGILLTADDNRYAAVEWNGGYYLVSGNGTRMKATNRTYKDADDVYWYVTGDDETGYTLYYADTAADAKAMKNEYTGK